jgi:hypothetical protein
MNRNERVRGYPGFSQPISIPAEAFEELEPIRRESDGRLLRRMRLKALGPEGPILTEDPMDQLFDIGEIKVEPLPMPSAAIFYLDADPFGKPDD